MTEVSLNYHSDLTAEKLTHAFDADRLDVRHPQATLTAAGSTQASGKAMGTWYRVAEERVAPGR